MRAGQHSPRGTALFIAAALLVALTGCALNTPPTPTVEQIAALGLPRQVLVTEVSPDSSATPQPPWLVVVQREGRALRWLRFNLLGAPDARQLLEDGRWRNDGFMAPNAPARELFAALLFAWTAQDDAEVHPRWHVMRPGLEPSGEFAIVRQQDGVRWEVRPVSPVNHPAIEFP